MDKVVKGTREVRNVKVRNLRGEKMRKKTVSCNETLDQKKNQKRDGSLNERGVST